MFQRFIAMKHTIPTQLNHLFDFLAHDSAIWAGIGNLTGIGWGSSTKATDRGYQAYSHDGRPRRVTEMRETGWVSLSPLPLSSFSNLASASLRGGSKEIVLFSVFIYNEGSYIMK